MESDDTTGHLLQLDSFCLGRIAQFLTCPRDLASLQVTCRTLRHLLQPSEAWTAVLTLNYGGLQLQRRRANVLSTSVPAKELCRLLKLSAEDLHPVRFVALYTDGGVDTGTLHYWADHAFIPNSWAPFCAKYSDNVNLLAVLKTGPDATGELAHRRMMIGCLKWVLPVLQQNLIPNHPETHPVDPAALNEAAEMLSAWKTQRLESFFCQMAARAAARDPLGLTMLRGLPAAMEVRNAAQEQRPVDPVKSLEERREAARVLGQGIQMRTWYDRAYRLNFIPPPHQQQKRPQPAPGPLGRGGLPPGAAEAAGPRGDRPAGILLRDSPYVLDEMALRSELMDPEAASSVAILQGLAVSREGRLSCPVQSGALLAGLLPPDWPQGALEAAAALAGGAAPASNGVPSMQSYEATMRAMVEQPLVRALNDKQDAESVFAACANGQLPPWVRHVLMEHAEYIELLPPHLAAAAVARPGGLEQGAVASAGGGAPGDGTSGSSAHPLSGIPKLHPVLWFRFTDHAEYSRRRLSTRARNLLRHAAELFCDAAELLEGGVDHQLDALRAEVVAWAGPRPVPGAGGAAGRQATTQGLETALATTGAGGAATTDGAGTSYAASSPPAAVRATVATSSPLTSRSPLPESLSQALHHALRRADRLTSLGTAAAVLAPELREAAGFSLPGGDVHGLLEKAMAMKATLSYVARQLSCVEELSRAVHGSELPVRRAPRRSVSMVGEAEEEGMETYSSDEDVDDEDTKLEDVQRSPAAPVPGLPVPRGLGSDPRRDAMEVEAGEGQEGEPEAGRVAGEAQWVELTLRTEVQGLWNALEGEALGEDGRQSRLALAAALRRQQAAAVAAAVAQTGAPLVREHRNEEVLRRLPVELLPPTPSPPDAAAAPPPMPPDTSDASGAAGSSSSGGTMPAPQAAADAASLPVLEPPPPDGWAAERLFDPQLQYDVDSGRVVLPETDEDGHRVLHLAARLLFPVAANAVVFKAIRPENLMAMVGWDENEQPNVDMQYVGLQGRVVRLPPGVEVVPWM